MNAPNCFPTSSDAPQVVAINYSITSSVTPSNCMCPANTSSSMNFKKAKSAKSVMTKNQQIVRETLYKKEWTKLHLVLRMIETRVKTQGDSSL